MVQKNQFPPLACLKKLVSPILIPKKVRPPSNLPYTLTIHTLGAVERSLTVLTDVPFSAYFPVNTVHVYAMFPLSNEFFFW